MTEPLDQLYEGRFDEREVSAKQVVWDEIARYLQRYVDPALPVLDVACDRGYFIRSIHAGERWATDLRDMRAALPDDVHFVQSSGLDLASSLPTAYFGTVFMSNYLEHLESSETVIEQLTVARELLARAAGSSSSSPTSASSDRGTGTSSTIASP